MIIYIEVTPRVIVTYGGLKRKKPMQFQNQKHWVFPLLHILMLYLATCGGMLCMTSEHGGFNSRHRTGH